jgi:hypothetical protein
MVAMPLIDATGLTSVNGAFYGCNALTCVPPLDISQCTKLDYTFCYCYSLMWIPALDTSNITNMTDAFSRCYLLTKMSLNTSNATNLSGVCFDCWSLRELTLSDTSKATNMSGLIRNSALNVIELDAASATSIALQSYTLLDVKVKNLAINLSLTWSNSLSKSSLLYIINNEAATSEITITLHPYAYSRLAEDADVVAALANHPLISLASA